MCFHKEFLENYCKNRILANEIAFFGNDFLGHQNFQNCYFELSSMVKDIVFGQFVEFRFQKISLTPKFHQNHEKLSSKSTSASKIMLDSVLEIPKTVFPTSLLKFSLLTPNAASGSSKNDR